MADNTVPQATDQPPAPLPTAIIQTAAASPISWQQQPSATVEVTGYDILGVLGRGGMGVVYWARQTALKREVALKMVLAGSHAGPEDLTRFQVEAEAVARLQHPHIVQIHEIGNHRGLPYFSLEFVNGGSLAGYLRGQPQAPRQAAAFLQPIARAVHYAHQRGIVHRDLKPANILLHLPEDLRQQLPTSGLPGLGVFVPKISDFGLAKHLEGNQETTQPGAIVGTPSYMAPEQALGQSRHVGPAADVYALGAILYELLTGAPPFRGATFLETAQMVAHTDCLPPSASQPRTPRDLETICLKCLHKDPTRRYASADDLAEDLRRFLADEPIQARPAGRIERLVKWTRRHPTAAALVGVILVAAAALLIVWARFTVSLRHERDLADANFRRAMQAVEQMLVEVGAKELEDEPRMEEKRRALLEKALVFYEGFLEERGGDRDVREKTARAYKKVADLQRQLNLQDRSEASYYHAIGLLDKLTQEKSTPELRHQLADCHNWLGELLRGRSRPQEARQAYLKAAEILKELQDAAPAAPEPRKDRARALMNLGLVAREENQPKEAVALFEQAIAMLHELSPWYGKMPAIQQELARCHLNLAPVQRRLGQEKLAIDSYDRAISTLRQLVNDRHPPSAEHLFELALALHNRGNFNAQRQGPERVKFLESAHMDFAGARIYLAHLVKDFPKTPRYRLEMANALNSSAVLYVAQENIDQASASWAEARRLQQELIEDFPKTTAYRGDLGMTLGNLGWLCQKQKQWTEARDHLLLGIKEIHLALAPNPRHPDYAESLRNQRRDLAEVCLQLGDHAAAAQQAALLPQALTGRPADHRLAAVLLVRCGPVAADDDKLTREQKNAAVLDYQLQALAQVQQAVALGFPVARLRGDAALDPLKSLAEYNKLLKESSP